MNPLLALLAAGTAGLTWSLVEARAFVLRRYRVPVLPPGAHPIRVLHVSDMHLLPRQGKKISWVSGLAELEPDLVVSTGDNLAHPEAVPAALRAYGALLDLPGAFVLGSNDVYAPKLKNPARYLLPKGGRKRQLGATLPTADLVAGLRAGGWLDLDNRRGRLSIHGTELELRGVDDAHLGQDRYDAVAGAPATAADIAVGVMHAPYRRTLDAMAEDGLDLMFAGHTHGGQLCLPGIGTLVTNCDLPRSKGKGLSHWQGPSGHEAWLHVSAGLGTSPYTPVRFACRPEAALLTLEARDSA